MNTRRRVEEITDWITFRDWYLQRYLRYAINAAVAASACNFKSIIHARHANSSHNSTLPSTIIRQISKRGGLIIHSVAQRPHYSARFVTIPGNHPIFSRDMPNSFYGHSFSPKTGDRNQYINYSINDVERH